MAPPYEDGWKAETDRAYAAMDTLKAPRTVENLEKVKDVLQGKSFEDIATMSANGLLVRVSRALDIEVPEVTTREYVRPVRQFLIPIADRMEQIACENVPIDPALREILRLTREGAVRKLSSLELTTLHRLERVPVKASAAVPDAITKDRTLSNVAKYEKARAYQQRLKDNLQVVNLRGNLARLIGEGRPDLASYVRDQIAACEKRIRDNGGEIPA